MARAILLVAAVCALAHVAAACCSGMVMDQLGLNLLENAEGYRSNIYNDAAGHPTICYGHLITPGEQLNPPLSQAQCQALLQQDLASAQSCVQNAVQVSLNQNQFSALVDFAFNLGCGALQSSTLLRLLNQGQYSSVPAQLNRWVHAGGRVLPGLVTRRANEGALWNTPVSGGGGSGGSTAAPAPGGATTGAPSPGGATTAAPAPGGATTAAPSPGGATTAAPSPGGATTAAPAPGGATTAAPAPATTAAPAPATTAAPTAAATTAAPTAAATTAAPTQAYTTPAATQPATTGGGFFLAEESAQTSSKSSGLSTTETALLAVGVVAGAICIAVGIIVRMRSRRSEDVQLLNAAEL